MTIADKAIMSTVIEQGRCIGFLIRTAKGVRAYDAAENELGTHESEADALRAIYHKQGSAP